MVAHRGASAYAPEHSIAAYDLALELGADALELDVRLTRDGEIVVLHDPTLARTTGDPRAIADVDLAEIASRRQPPRLDALFERYGRSTGWLIELKDPTPALERALLDMLHDHRLLASVTIQSFDRRSLVRLRRVAPSLRVAPLLCESHDGARALAHIRRASRFASGVGVLHSTVDAAVAQAARAAGIELRAYTVNDRHEMERLLLLGVDGLITDVPDVARGAVLAGGAVRAAA